MTEKILKTTLKIEHHEFEYTLIRSKNRRRTLALSMEQPLQIQLRAPFRTSIKEANDFLAKNHHWILKRQTELKTRPYFKPIQEWEHGDRVPFLGDFYLLHLIEEPLTKASIYLHEKHLMLHIPTHIISELRPQLIASTIINWYKKNARIIAQQKMLDWAEKLKVNFNALIISGPHKRWGSCNYRNDIRINWRAVLAPSEALDYLIAHELCHVKHKNHSSAFWKMLGNVLPNYAELQKVLHQHHIFLSI